MATFVGAAIVVASAVTFTVEPVCDVSYGGVTMEPSSTVLTSRSSNDVDEVVALGSDCSIESGLWPVIRDDAAVRTLLPSVVAKLREYIPNAEFSVISHRDPEGASKLQVFVVAKSARTPEDMLTRLARFDEEWWLDRQEPVEGRLEVTVECD